MKISPEEFTELLKKSSLTKDQRVAVIKMLKGLTMEQINNLADILRKDAAQVQRIISETDENQKAEIVNFITKINKIKVKDPKK